MGTRAKWQFWIDRGGTFTDVVARADDGSIVTEKLLSENPGQYADAAIEGIRRILRVDGSLPIPAAEIEAVKMGTTVATNALLERKGEPTALVINKGFRDALRIAYQNRPDIFAMEIKLPEQLYSHVVEVDCRVDADGAELQALDTEAARASMQEIYDKGIRSVAIVLMHGYRFHDHEIALKAIAGRIGFEQISVGHEVSPLMKIVGRGDTTVVDAYLTPILRRYVDRVADALGDVRLLFMQSNGGLTDAHQFQGKDAILSGPAGGVVGAARTAAALGHDRIIGFDMGGTSTDVSHFDGRFERTQETLVAGVRLKAPMLDIHTIAAGGGSILFFDGQRMRVGPESAGADPGPCAYRKKGPLTVTDCNVLLGRINAPFFPHVFGEDADQPLDEEAVKIGFATLTSEINAATGRELSVEEVAEGFLKIAVENMANAIKKISVERGHDVTHYTMASFGGAGGQHACLVADALAIPRVLIHPLAGVLSAYGMGLAELSRIYEEAVEAEISEPMFGDLDRNFGRLEERVIASLNSQGVEGDKISLTRRARIRYLGTDTSLEVIAENFEAVLSAFAKAHRQRFGFLSDGTALIVESISVEGTGGGLENDEGAMTETLHGSPPPTHQTTRMFAVGQWRNAEIYERTSLAPGHFISGPAVIVEDTATTVLEPDWAAEVLADGSLLLQRTAALPARTAIGTDADPVMLEIFNNLFMAIAEQMGVTLENTSHSVNIKERLDFSCAIFDPAANLIANAPHMPVHLGSMGESVATILNAHKGAMEPGDVFALNAPYNGGTHLPDITVITPVFLEHKAGSDPDFFVASRGHHADIGGITPGSMPSTSVSVDQEGVLIDDFQLVSVGQFKETELRQLLGAGAWPARNPDRNVADLRAQIAANEKGVQELFNMVAQFGSDVVHAYMGHVQDNAEEAVRRVIEVLEPGSFRYSLDNGSEIRVRISLDRKERTAVIDFTGTSDQLDSNFNAPSAVCKAAVLYVFRCLVADNIPMNAGCLKPLTIVIPEGSMLSPKFPSAVVAGNVETSQCITDALFGALQTMAGAQGTMNNFTFGDERWQYYETVSGGSGAGPGFNGTSAVQTHMTNSRLTDPEVLEMRFPVLLESFTIREGSGGRGAFHGGDGTVRRIKFLEPMTASILANNHICAPFGLEGGEDGKSGCCYVERKDGQTVRLSSSDVIEMRAGDTFVIETPGGGGFGRA